MEVQYICRNKKIKKKLSAPLIISSLAFVYYSHLLEKSSFTCYIALLGSGVVNQQAPLFYISTHGQLD